MLSSNQVALFHRVKKDKNYLKSNCSYLVSRKYISLLTDESLNICQLCLNVFVISQVTDSTPARNASWIK